MAWLWSRKCLWIWHQPITVKLILHIGKKKITQIVNYGLSGQGAGKKSGWKTTPMCKKGKQSIVMCKCNGPMNEEQYFHIRGGLIVKRLKAKWRGKKKTEVIVLHHHHHFHIEHAFQLTFKLLVGNYCQLNKSIKQT